jgi:hypothetical protein
MIAFSHTLSALEYIPDALHPAIHKERGTVGDIKFTTDIVLVLI